MVAIFRWAVTDPDAAGRFSEQSGIRPYHGSMEKELPILYTKRGCPWCEEAIAFLDEHGVGYRHKEVTSDAQAFEEMTRKSGQGKTPTLDWNGTILADFGTDELVPFLQNRGVKLEDS
jgi:glutaredoxin 3